MNDALKKAASELADSYAEDGIKIHHLDRQPLPSHAEIIRVLVTINELLFPGYIGAQGLAGSNLRTHVEARMSWLYETLTEQISRAISHGAKIEEACTVTDRDANDCATALLAKLPATRQLIAGDVQAAYDGDPAANCLDEIIFSYPSIYALMVYRVAHELYQMEVPLIPRIMTEHAHHRTGIDIHPGTRIGSRFFIDHGTGVVIGGTAVIGNNVKIFQGVTLGAFSFDKEEDGGQLIRNTKRHPTIEDDVVIYAGATILGGETVIGRGSVIGGNVWLTHSVPAGTRVLQDSPNLRIIPADEVAS